MGTILQAMRHRFSKSTSGLLAFLFFITGVPFSAWAVDDPVLEPYFIASAAYNRKLYPVAVSQFESFLKKNPDHAKADLARRGLGLSLYALKLYPKAIPHFEALLAKPSLDKTINRERLIMLQGQCLLYSGEKDKASKHFMDWHAKLKTPAFRTAALAKVCDLSFEKSQWEVVIEWTSKLAASGPDDNQAARGLYQRGFALYQTDKIEEAAVALAKVGALETIPEWKTRSAYLQGECHVLLDQLDKAEPALAAALPGMTGPEKATCQYRLGLARYLLKKYELAIVDFEAYLKLPKSETDEKKPRKGKKKKKFLDAGANVEDARFFIARSHFELEDYNKAEKGFSSLATGANLIAAKANLWWARVHARGKSNYERAAQILGESTLRLNKPSTGLHNAPIIDDLEFDYANALIGSKKPDWKLAAGALSNVEGRGKFAQMAEVTAQRATCLHKLKNYANSLKAADLFISRYKDHALLGDTRFLRAENLYLLNKGDESAEAFSEFIASHKGHGSVFASQMRIAQIHHNAKRWDQALASAGPLLAKKPEGRFFSQLSFVVGDCLFRQEKWKESTKPLEDFVAERVEITETPNGKNKKYKVTVGPNLDTALVQLAVAYDRAGEREKAIGHLITLVDHYPEETPHLPLALSDLGRLAYQTSDLRRARSALERFLKADKLDKAPFKNTAGAHRTRVNYYLGWVNAMANKYKESAEHFSKVPHNDPLGSDAALQHGIGLINIEDFESAAKHFPQMLNRFKEHEKLQLVVYYSGLSAAKREDWRNAATYLKRVLADFPKAEFADQALYEWAWAERSMKRDKEATALYERLLAEYPKSSLAVKVQSEMAELNMDAGAQEKVIAELTATLEKVTEEPLRESIRTQLAAAHFKKGDHEVAAKMFEELLVAYPATKLRASMLFQAGESRFQLKETLVARGHFEAAVKVSRRDAVLTETLVMRLGETQAKTGQNKEAVNTYRDFLKRFEDSKWKRNAQFGLGFALENSNNPSEAIKEYRKLFDDQKKVDLWTVRARFQSGECYFNMQQYEQAVAEFVNIEINFGKYRDWQAKSVLEIARVLLAQKKKEEAIDRLKDVVNNFSKEKAATVARQYLEQLRSG